MKKINWLIAYWSCWWLSLKAKQEGDRMRNAKNKEIMAILQMTSLQIALFHSLYATDLSTELVAQHEENGQVSLAWGTRLLLLGYRLYSAFLP